MRYKVGDKVRVRKDLVVGKDYGNFAFADTMKKLREQVVTIKNVLTDSYYLIEEDTDEYSWTDEMLEPVITNWDKVKEELNLEDFSKRSGICIAIHRVRKEKNCNGRSCEECREWLKQPYQEPSILNDTEKEYLKAVIKPFRDKVAYIALCEYDESTGFIRIKTEGDLAGVCFPNFRINTMYKGMEIGKRYTLEDLDL